MFNKTKPYDGIIDMLSGLNKNNIKIAVVSNKYDKAVKKLCEKYFNGKIQVAIGESENIKKKPAPDCVLEVLKQLGAIKNESLYVGDSEVDVQTAKNAEISCVGVTWGFRSRETLICEGADYIIDAPSDLLKLIKEKTLMQGKVWANCYEIEKIYMGRIPHDFDLLEQINSFCFENDIKSGTVNIIGAVKQAKIGYYSQDTQTYRTLEGENLQGGLEIVSCTGNISIKDAKPFAHVHIVLSDSKGKTFGGHLMPGTIVYAGEFVIQKFKGSELVRCLDEVTKLPLWQLLQ